MILKGPMNIKGEKGKNSHGGEGEYFVRTFLTGEFNSSLKYVRELMLEPGSSVGIHKHKDDEEVYYVICGNGIMVVDGEEKVVGEGDIVLTKTGSYHGLRNHTSHRLKIFVACAAVRKE